MREGCILSKFYIKPQPLGPPRGGSFVVSYRNSTSNHNPGRRTCSKSELYLIEILHQTTTRGRATHRHSPLYLIEILHQTTTYPCHAFFVVSVVSYRNSTSNHNNEIHVLVIPALYLIEILHQTTTEPGTCRTTTLLYLIEILHQTTTVRRPGSLSSGLYLIEILHQTTTSSDLDMKCFTLYLIEILHQTTTVTMSGKTVWSCILSKFYIKPQLHGMQPEGRRVVSYRNSTSNHNYSRDICLGIGVVSYRNSTSNHNLNP